MLEMMLSATKNADYYATKYESRQRLSETARQVLSSFKAEPERQMSTKTICNELGIPRRTAVVVLNQLLDNGFI